MSIIVHCMKKICGEKGYYADKIRIFSVKFIDLYFNPETQNNTLHYSNYVGINFENVCKFKTMVAF